MGTRFFTDRACVSCDAGALGEVRDAIFICTSGYLMEYPLGNARCKVRTCLEDFGHAGEITGRVISYASALLSKGQGLESVD